MNKSFKARALTIAAILALTLVISGVVVAQGGNIFRNETTTAGGYSTWDSDMINIEQVSETGDGVYVAVLDTGMVPNWRDYFPEDRVATELGKGFYQNFSFKLGNDKCADGSLVGPLIETTWVGSTGSTHGTHVASTILGYFYDSNFDTVGGFPLPPIMVRGIAPDVTVIPVKVLADYQIPATPKCASGALPAFNAVFGTSEMVAAGIDYATDLAIAGYRPMVINMSLGGGALETVEQNALDRAIANGVIVVASAGNEGTDGMGYPGAYPPVISAGASGWINEWLVPGDGPFYRMWWLQSNLLPYEDIPEPTPVSDVYVTNFSSRELPGQELDVLAPGSWVRGPFPGFPGYSHLPWWSSGIGDLVGINPGNFYYVGGTSMASPHVASVAALMMQKNPGLTQAQVEGILKSTALPVPPGSVFVFRDGTQTWGADATGAGLIQADAALSATP